MRVSFGLSEFSSFGPSVEGRKSNTNLLHSRSVRQFIYKYVTNPNNALR